MTSKNWSSIEVHAVVADYFAMLAKELAGEKYNKTTHRLALSVSLNNRPHGSIERKHQNISAILIEQGYPYVSGYKPLGNYQRLLADAVLFRITGDSILRSMVEKAVEAPAVQPTVADILQRMVAAPKYEQPQQKIAMVRESDCSYQVRAVNYLEVEARNTSLGLAGEQFVVNFEQARLISLGKDRLADKVEHIPSTRGDGAGFDIKSYETDGTDRLIEVKTTAYGKQTPVFLSANELRVSQEYERKYHLYRVFQFRHDPRLFTMSGALSRNLRLEPVQFRGFFN